MSKRLHAKYQLILSDFNEIWIFSTDFRNKFKYQVSLKSASGSRVVPCGQTNMTKRTVAFTILRTRLETGTHKLFHRFFFYYYPDTSYSYARIWSGLSCSLKAPEISFNSPIKSSVINTSPKNQQVSSLTPSLLVSLPGKSHFCRRTSPAPKPRLRCSWKQVRLAPRRQLSSEY
jgi:hypothetical protein